MSDAPLPSSFDGDRDFYEENRWQIISRRLKEEPLIPLGVGLTCWALYSASRSIRTGNAAKTNQMFRYRLYAQSFTIVAMLGGSVYYKADRLKRNEFVKIKKREEAQEKRDAWIRELEARDAEDKEWRAKMGRVRDLQREEAEQKAVEELRAKEAMKLGDMVRSDDGRGVIAAVKEQNNAAKERERRVEAVERERAKEGKPVIRGEAVTGLAVTDAMNQAASDAKQEKRETLLGESEQGGLFGIGHLKNFLHAWKGEQDSAESEKSAGPEKLAENSKADR